MKFVELSEEEFASVASTLEHANFHQTVAWAKIKESNGWKEIYLGLKDENNKIVGASLILKKKLIFNYYMGYAPRGFLIDFKNEEVLDFFTKELKKYGKKHNFIFIKIDPLYKYQERNKEGEIVENGFNNKELVDYLKRLGYIHHGINADIYNELQPRFISVLDIKDKSYEELFSNMRRGTRKVLRRSNDGGLNVVEVNDISQLKIFKELTIHTADRRGFIDRPLSYYEKFYEEFNKYNMIKVVLGEMDFNFMLKKAQNHLEEVTEILKNDPDNAEMLANKAKYEKQIPELTEEIKNNGEKKIVSAIMFILYNKEIVALTGASIDKYMQYNAHYYIHDYMLKYATANNYESYNFYGISGVFDEKDPNYGLFYFKRGFNADVIELIGEFDLIINSPMYRFYNWAFKTYKKLKNIKNHIKN